MDVVLEGHCLVDFLGQAIRVRLVKLLTNWTVFGSVNCKSVQGFLFHCNTVFIFYLLRHLDFECRRVLVEQRQVEGRIEPGAAVCAVTETGASGHLQSVAENALLGSASVV